jgi:transcription initiation factor TFIID subunit TAF12
MSIDTLPAQSSAQPVNGHAETNGANGQEGVEQLQDGLAALKVEAQHQQQQEQQQQQNGGDVQGQLQDVELHRACAGGNVEEVRGVLSRGLESLEVLGEFSFGKRRDRFMGYKQGFG